MEKYKYCNLQDLAWDDVFRQWVLSPTPETNAVWHQWLSENPERWDIVQDASQIVRSVKVNEPTNIVNTKLVLTVNFLGNY